jgi:Type ISP C-terminal specificity domain/N-6 DNA Methylase
MDPGSRGLPAMRPPAAAEFAAALRAYVTTLTANFASLTSAQPEDQLKAPVGDLLVAAGKAAGRSVLSRTESRVDGVAGRPDLGVDADALPVGNLELKAPGNGARPDAFADKRSREQWERFKALPNLLYTDGREWALYRSGVLINAAVTLPFDPTRASAADVTESDSGQLLDLLAVFLRWEPVVPSTPRALAEMLAPLTRLLRDEVLADLREGGVMARLASEWRATLFPGINDATFADGYAQTFSYALLLARLEGASAPIDAESASKALDADHALLAQALRVLGQPGTHEAIGMPVDLLERVIGAVDASRLAKGSDPWLYFYEDFLAAYDPVQRKNRGVYYTPIEVVEAQARVAERLLTDRLGKRNGFGDEDVVVLDPAVGTGTYPIAVIEQTLERVEAHGGPGLVQEVATVLARNVNAFEILVGPYAVTHLRLSRILADAGAAIPVTGVNVFLTDTLATPAHPGFAKQATLFEERLAAEQERASHVKAPDTFVTVVLGNPPYHRDDSGYDSSGRKNGGMVRHGDSEGEIGLLRDFLDPLPKKVRADHGMNLYNDYVYFMRWGIWKTAEQHPDRASILTFITASSYLAGPAYGGLRQMLRKFYDEVWIVDLFGGGRGTLKDDNVFEGVLTPVAILVAVRVPDVTARDRIATPAVVRYRPVHGSRDDKLAALEGLAELDASTGWVVSSSGWQDPLIPPGIGSFAEWPKIDDLMPWTARGIQFSRTWGVSESRQVLTARWKQLVSAPPRERAGLVRESDGCRVDREYGSFLTTSKLKRLDSLTATDQPDGIERVAFRSFDRQWCLADRRLIERPRPPLWHTLSDHQVFTTFLPMTVTAGPAVVAHTAVPDLNATVGSNGGLVVPLYRDQAATIPNITAGLLELLESVYGTPVTAEDLLAYIFGLLGNGAYATRFARELEISPPSVPVTVSGDLFFRVAALGRALLWYACAGERFQPLDEKGRPVTHLPPGTAKNTKAVPNTAADYPDDYSYVEGTKTIRVGSGEFAPVDPAVWHFEVSGLRILESWLGYRMKKRAGRSSSDLDKIRPTAWTFSGEFVELLAVIERFVAATEEAAAILKEVVDGDLIEPARFPTPTEREREGPSDTDGPADQIRLALA